MNSSPRLSLAYLSPQQAQKHVTVNEALRRLDALVSLAVQSRTLAAQPATPAEGDAYILPAAPSGADWSTFAPDALAIFQDGAWMMFTPLAGLRAYVVDEAAVLVYDGGWTSVLSAAGMFGVNAGPDATNRLAVKSDAVLFSHDDVTPGSGDVRQVINKSAAAKTASVLFQSGFSGRAEFGLTGDDDFHMKVSPDGASFFEGMNIRRTDGKVSFPAGLASALSVSNGGTGSTTGLGALASLGFRIAFGQIADDTAKFADFGGPVFGSAILAVSNSVANAVTGFFHARMASGPNVTTLFSAGPAFALTTGALTGTTGPDGQITLSATSDGKFYVENRVGFAVSYTFYVFL